MAGSSLSRRSLKIGKGVCRTDSVVVALLKVKVLLLLLLLLFGGRQQAKVVLTECVLAVQISS